MNKMVNVQHCTILWPVNDNNILHVILKVVDGVLSQLVTKYGKVSPLSVSQGRMDNYLGMQINFSSKGKVCITVHNHIEGVMESEEEDTTVIVETPTASHLFTEKEDGGTLWDL